jgi:hypothetical protein
LGSKSKYKELKSEKLTQNRSMAIEIPRGAGRRKLILFSSNVFTATENPHKMSSHTKNYKALVEGWKCTS